MNFNLTKPTEIVQAITSFIDVLIPLIFAIALIVFIWGVFQYFIAGGADEEKRSTGRKLVMWAIIGFVIMVSVWGIVNLLTNTLGFDNANKPKLPTFGNTSMVFPHSQFSRIDVEPLRHIL